MEEVWADDFSGAAEVAGVGFRYGLAPTVQLGFPSPRSCELTVIDTDSRSRSRDDAVCLVQSALEQNNCAFKKIDSVLRGHVLAEIQPFLDAARCRRALVVPFNPALGRTIRDGVYRVEGRPISETAFRDDPEYPAFASDVCTMLGPGAVRVCRLSDPLPEAGIIVGEGQTPEELRGWAARVDEKTLPVGGAPFFAAWLEYRGKRVTRGDCKETGGNTLLVSGTLSRVAQWRDVLRMPEPLFNEGSPEALQDWANRIALALSEKRFVVASIGAGRLLDRSQSARLVEHLADVTVSVLAHRGFDQLWLEGGATASAVVRKLGWKSFQVVGELAPGVVQLLPAGGGPVVVVKPGSYPYQPPGK